MRGFPPVWYALPGAKRHRSKVYAVDHAAGKILKVLPVLLSQLRRTQLKRRRPTQLRPSFAQRRKPSFGRRIVSGLANNGGHPRRPCQDDPVKRTIALQV